ncbi:MAG: 5'-nucleotidase C-terminal domain-containing protein [Erysipelotrichaceae bacterium]|nr:5'-nucleotidase C-terminal domain-containing protein [Erysipelotrichaceae bacterium]MDD3924746.1 5'-nucleotidase C-terminal domain-containing protein [Erysipelotrichaceae bacterium]MDD4642910.1 5'-nucleotidase C-terminal domain-containing protein [Erysipelotrichaceae bacterium]
MAVVDIDILGHADYNGTFKESLKGPGLLRFYGAIESVRSLNPNRTLLIDVGDNISRSLWKGKVVMEGLNLIKTDVMTLGNHEFDNGKEFLEKAIENNPFPVLCANIFEKETGNRVKGTKPYVLLEKDGIKIGIIGLTTEYTPYMVEKSAFAPYYVKPAKDFMYEYVPVLKEMGAEIIIAATHFPFYTEPLGGELIDFIDGTEDLGVDCYIGGHIPGDYGDIYKGFAVLKGGFGGDSLPHATLQFDTEKRIVVSKKARVIDVKHGEFLVDNKEIETFVEKVTRPYAHFFEEVLAYNENDLSMRLSYESPLGNFMSDCLRATARTQIAYMNATSCGGTLLKGDITREHLVLCNGFNDPIKITRVKGQDIWDLFELVYEPDRYGNNATLIFSGLVVEIDNSKKSPFKVQRILLDDNEPIRLNDTYTIATSQYMASGGNDTSLFSSRFNWEDIGITMHDALFNYVRKLKSIRMPKAGRLIMNGKPENDNAPF